MRDFNFFSHITEERKSDSKRKYIGFGLIGALVFIFVVNFSINIIHGHVLDKNISYYEGEIDNPDMKEKLGIATKVEKEHDALENYYNDVKVAIEQVYDNNYVTTQRIKIINSTVPKDLVFTQISIDNKTLTIQALSKTRSAISDLQYNLNNLGFIENTYISGIGERNAQGDYSFSISCTLKEVGNNEN
ncbi:PilN domain-containing protein [Clostridium perfringens]|uniref:PilN domain-containing protein n=1 Tax=Clostridium perfringens TaxID=1502 RepID=UPI0018E490D5|nr:PilN domain-containing protein [Clostridium perfringens]MBI6101802.1 PilN domain-containing protein [Clostridium perfringens]